VRHIDIERPAEEGEPTADAWLNILAKTEIAARHLRHHARPELMNAKRKKRVAAGAGRDVQEVNKLLKMHQEMGRAMKQIRKMGGLKGLGALFGGGGGMGGAPGGMGGPQGGGTMPGLPGGQLPPDMADFLKKK
jgi:signal recognition particle subunit SRP54